MGLTFNPFTGKIDFTGDAGAVAGSDKQVIFNDGGTAAGDSALIWHKTNNQLEVGTATGFTDSVNIPLSVGIDQDSWGGIYLQNLNAGQSASSDLVIGADDDNTGFLGHYVDVGVNSSAYVGSDLGIIRSVSIAAGGTGYHVGDTLTITGGDGNAELEVLTLSGSAVATVAIINDGTSYTVSSANATTVSPAGGSGCTINITLLWNTAGLSAGDAYILSSGGDLLIGTDAAEVGNNIIKIFTNGWAPTNERIRITPTGMSIGGFEPTVALDVGSGNANAVFYDLQMVNTWGFSEHFRDNTATYPTTWTQVDAPASTNTNEVKSFWKISGSNAELSWKFRKATTVDLENDVTSGYGWSAIWGPIVLRDAANTTDIDYYLGIYRDNGGTIDENTFSRIHVHWDSATSVWQVRGQRKDGATLTSGTYITFVNPLPQGFYLKTSVLRNTNKNARANISMSNFQEAFSLLAKGDLGSGVTLGHMWLQISMLRVSGSGTLGDIMYLGGVDVCQTTS